MHGKTIPLVLLACLALSACESMRVNGVSLQQNSGVSAGNEATFCAQHPAVCIGAGVVAAGALGLVIHNQTQDDNNAGGGPPPD